MSTSSWSQNVAGPDHQTQVGFFFGGFNGLLNNVEIGWYANGPGVVDARVLAIDPSYNAQSITIEGPQIFLSGQSYIFTSFMQHVVACFVKGSRILVKDKGYIPIETLVHSDLVATSLDKSTFSPCNLVHTHVPIADQETAPYIILAHAFGRNNPRYPVSISGTHKFLLRKGVWMCAKVAVLKNPKVVQYGIGESVDYYHVKCVDYLRDNLVVEGLVAESYGTMKTTRGLQNVYTWNRKLDGFTRVGPGSLPRVLE